MWRTKGKEKENKLPTQIHQAKYPHNNTISLKYTAVSHLGIMENTPVQSSLLAEKTSIKAKSIASE